MYTTPKFTTAPVGILPIGTFRGDDDEKKPVIPPGTFR